MRTFVTPVLFLTMELIYSTAVAFSDAPEDLDGSGYDLEGLGSGSGDWAEQGHGHGSSVRLKDPLSSRSVRITAAKAGGGTWNISDDLTPPMSPWPEGDTGPAGKQKKLIESKEAVAGVVAGAVTGVVLAVALAVILISREQRKVEGGSTVDQMQPLNAAYSD